MVGCGYWPVKGGQRECKDFQFGGWFGYRRPRNLSLDKLQFCHRSSSDPQNLWGEVFPGLDGGCICPLTEWQAGSGLAVWGRLFDLFCRILWTHRLAQQYEGRINTSQMGTQIPRFLPTSHTFLLLRTFFHYFH